VRRKKNLVQSLAKIVKLAFGTTFALSIIFAALYFFGARQLGALEAKYDLMRTAILEKFGIAIDRWKYLKSPDSTLKLKLVNRNSDI
jgi:hypothetical protein